MKLNNIKKNITLWRYRVFRVISQGEAEELGLEWYRNVFGDQINILNCRSLWVDKKGRRYRVSELKA